MSALISFRPCSANRCLAYCDCDVASSPLRALLGIVPRHRSATRELLVVWRKRTLGVGLAAKRRKHWELDMAIRKTAGDQLPLRVGFQQPRPTQRNTGMSRRERCVGSGARL